MSHQLTHFRHFFRKLSRDESRPGNLKKLIGALFLTILTLFFRQVVSHELDSVFLIKSLFALRGAETPASDLVVINVDDESYSKLKLSPRKPFPRGIAARAIEQIQNENPKLLILDLHFPEERDSEEQIADTKALAAALTLGPTTIALSPFSEKPVESSKDLFFSDPWIREAARYEVPMNINYVLDIARYIHRDPMRASTATPENTISLLTPLRETVNPEIKSPAPYDLINFYGGADTIRSFSMWEFFSEERRIPQGFFKDKIVVLGFKSKFRERGTTAKEVLNVPVKSGAGTYEMYGVEIHANIIGNLLLGDWIKRMSHGLEAAYLFFAIFILILAILLLEPKHSLIFGSAYLLIWFGVTYIAFAHFHYFIPGIFLALFSSTIIFGGASCVVATITLREIRELKKTLGMS